MRIKPKSKNYLKVSSASVFSIDRVKVLREIEDELIFNFQFQIFNLINADMAELADAHGSGPCESNFMQVQVLLSAP